MRPKVPLRWGFPIVPTILGLGQNKDGTTRLEGDDSDGDSTYQTTYRLWIQATESVHYGKLMPNGSYDGLTGMIQRDEIDMMTVPVETFIRHPPGEFAPVMCSYPHVILSATWSTEQQSLDCISTADVFDRPTYQVFTLSSIFWFIAMKYVARRFSIWETIGILLSQAFNSYETRTRRLIHLSGIVSLVMLEYIFGSMYSTDIAVEKPPKTIDPLEDLAESPNHKPIFFTMTSIYIQFMESEQAIHKRVWKKVEECGIQKCVVDIKMTTLQNNDYSDLHYAQVVSKMSLPVWTVIVSNAYGNTYLEKKAEGIITHLSKPFSEANYAFLMNRNSTIGTRDRIIEFSYWNIESGYQSKLLDDSGSCIENSVGPVCVDTLYKKDNEPGIIYPLPFMSIRRMVLLALMMFTAGLAALLMEGTLAEVQNRRRT